LNRVPHGNHCCRRYRVGLAADHAAEQHALLKRAPRLAGITPLATAAASTCGISSAPGT
jgi:hypothetical protein